MTEIARIAGLMQEVFEGHPYFGPSVMDVLTRVTAKEAAVKRRWMANSIWRIAVHLTAELRYAASVLDETAGPWVEGVTTWPRIRDKSRAAWQAAIDDLIDANRDLVERVKQLDDALLTRRPGTVRGSYHFMLHGTLQHNVFHAGELSMIAGGLGVRERGPDGVNAIGQG
jgi:hypothetical protein